MGILKKIITSMVESLDALVGRHVSVESFLIDTATIVSLLVVYFTSFVILAKSTKWKLHSRILVSIGITIVFIVIFCAICIIIDH